jgi:hypothetical protein
LLVIPRQLKPMICFNDLHFHEVDFESANRMI